MNENCTSFKTEMDCDKLKALEIDLNTDLQQKSHPKITEVNIKEEHYCDTIDIKEELPNNILLANKSIISNEHNVIHPSSTGNSDPNYTLESDSCIVGKEKLTNNTTVQFMTVNLSGLSRETLEEVTPCVCKVCKKTFSTKLNLIIHKCIPDVGKKKYICPVCNLPFSKSGITTHKRIHTGERKHVCDVCKKAFLTSSRLKEHKRTHTGDKPYTCDFCTKAFARSGDLKTHRRVHTGEKPYVCEICNKAYAKYSAITYHKLTHTGEKTHACDFCDMAFRQARQLTVHRRTHTAGKLYVCVICNKTFAELNKFVEHNLTHTATMT